MSENVEKEAIKKIKITWVEIIISAISILVIGAVSFVFNNFSSRLSDLEELTTNIKEKAIKTELTVDLDIRKNVTDVNKDLEVLSMTVTEVNNSQRVMERDIDRINIKMGDK